MNEQFPLVVIYDSDCGVCNASVQFILKNDRAGRFCFVSRGGEAGKELCASFGLDWEKEDSLVLIESNKAFLRSTAVMRVARHLGFPFSLAVVAYIIPTRLRDWLYSIFAKNRHRWLKRENVCILPDEKQRPRFWETLPPQWRTFQIPTAETNCK